MPELTTKSLFDGTYFKKFDSYVTDQFIKRDTFRKIKIDIELSTKGEYNNLYMYDDYIVEEMCIRDRFHTASHHLLCGYILSQNKAYY